MKILHCVSSLKVGGAEKLVKNLSISQIQNGESITILSFGHPQEEFQKALKGSTVIIENIRGNILKRQIQILKLIFESDIIHIHSPAVIRAFIFIFPFLMRKKILYTIHGEIAPNLNGMKFSHRIAQHYVDYTFAVSEKTRIKATEIFSWPSTKIVVIKNGITINATKTYTSSKKKLTLGIVSRLIPLKRVEDLIRCLAEFDLAKVSLVKIFGDGPEKIHLQKIIKELDLNNTVHLCGIVIDEEEIYSQIDCLIICSETEGLPMSLLESMGFGIPCISTKVGAIPNLIVESDGGFLYEVGDLEMLAKHIKHLVEEPALLVEKGAKARQYVTEHYAIEGIVETYKQYY